MVDWTKQHCGVIQAEYSDMMIQMPDLAPIIQRFPDNPDSFIWDVKVHMLMPGQYPCIPNWHYDHIPRDEKGKQDFDKLKGAPVRPLYMYVSGPPLTEFRAGDTKMFIPPNDWVKFYQTDEHRGTVAEDFCWRGFIRASHRDIAPRNVTETYRRHCQVYLDADNFKW